MEYQEFEQLVCKMRGRFFASGMRDTVNKSDGAFNAQQIYRLQGQFTSGGDRVLVVQDLSQSQRIMPMMAKDAEPIVKMGIYGGQRKSIMTLLASHIVDRQDPAGREILARNFTGADRMWLLSTLDQAGPYGGPPPPGSYSGPGSTITATYVHLPQPTNQNAFAYVARNTGTTLFGGLFSAEVPTPQQGVTTTVTYQHGVPQGQPQPANYPAYANYPPPGCSGVAYPGTYPGAQPYAQPAPTYGEPMTEPPPAYTPMYPPIPTSDESSTLQSPQTFAYPGYHDHGTAPPLNYPTKVPPS